MQAFGSLAQGAGQMAQAFLAGGDAAKTSFAQLAKSVAASLAAQALVHAAMEIAHGIAELAKAAANPLGAAAHAASAAMHFAAAKAYGIVGGVAAIAALAIPGGSAGAAGASQQSAAGPTFGAGNSSRPNTIEENRRRGEARYGQGAGSTGGTQEVHHYHHQIVEHRITAPQGFIVEELRKDHRAPRVVAELWRADYSKHGTSRQVVLTDGVYT